MPVDDVRVATTDLHDPHGHCSRTSGDLPPREAGGDRVTYFTPADAQPLERDACGRGGCRRAASGTRSSATRPATPSATITASSPSTAVTRAAIRRASHPLAPASPDCPVTGSSSRAGIPPPWSSERRVPPPRRSSRARSRRGRARIATDRRRLVDERDADLAAHGDVHSGEPGGVGELDDLSWAPGTCRAAALLRPVCLPAVVRGHEPVRRTRKPCLDAGGRASSRVLKLPPGTTCAAAGLCRLWRTRSPHPSRGDLGRPPAVVIAAATRSPISPADLRLGRSLHCSEAGSIAA